MSKEFRELTNRIASRQDTITPKLIGLSGALYWPTRGFVLLRGPLGGGLTATLLEAAKDLTQTKSVIFVDVTASIRLNRLEGVNQDNLILFRPGAVSDILDLAKTLSDKSPIFLIDGAYFYSKEIRIKGRIDYLCKLITSYCPGATIYVTDNEKMPCHTKDFGLIISIRPTGTKRENREAYGHELEIYGPKGIGYAFVDYDTGRFSEKYDYAMTLIKKGEASPSSTFNGYHGIWNYVKNENKQT